MLNYKRYTNGLEKKVTKKGLVKLYDKGALIYSDSNKRFVDFSSFEKEGVEAYLIRANTLGGDEIGVRCIINTSEQNVSYRQKFFKPRNGVNFNYKSNLFDVLSSFNNYTNSRDKMSILKYLKESLDFKELIVNQHSEYTKQILLMMAATNKYISLNPFINKTGNFNEKYRAFKRSLLEVYSLKFLETIKYNTKEAVSISREETFLKFSKDFSELLSTIVRNDLESTYTLSGLLSFIMYQINLVKFGMIEFLLLLDFSKNEKDYGITKLYKFIENEVGLAFLDMMDKIVSDFLDDKPVELGNRYKTIFKSVGGYWDENDRMEMCNLVSFTGKDEVPQKFKYQVWTYENVACGTSTNFSFQSEDFVFDRRNKNSYFYKVNSRISNDYAEKFFYKKFVKSYMKMGATDVAYKELLTIKYIKKEYEDRTVAFLTEPSSFLYNILIENTNIFGAKLGENRKEPRVKTEGCAATLISSVYSELVEDLSVLGRSVEKAIGEVLEDTDRLLSPTVMKKTFGDDRIDQIIEQLYENETIFDAQGLTQIELVDIPSKLFNINFKLTFEEGSLLPLSVTSGDKEILLDGETRSNFKDKWFKDELIVSYTRPGDAFHKSLSIYVKFDAESATVKDRQYIPNCFRDSHIICGEKWFRYCAGNIKNFSDLFEMITNVNFNSPVNSDRKEFSKLYKIRGLI